MAASLSTGPAVGANRAPGMVSWEIAEREYPERAGPRYSRLKDANGALESIGPDDRFFVRR
jgi:hypothetical protein